MISNSDLIHKAYGFLDGEPNTPTSNFISKILQNVTTWNKISPKQHTYITAYCMSCEIAEAQFNKELPGWL